MAIKIIAAEDKTWDSAVRKLDIYDVHYLHDYVMAFAEEDKANGEPVLFVYGDGSDYAINAVFKRDVAKDKHFAGRLDEGQYFDLITPYGYGGFLGHISDYDKLENEYREFCIEHGYISEFCRFSLFSDYHDHFPGFVETRTHNVVRDLTMPMDEMWMDFKQNIRKNVKRANKNGLEVIIDENDEYMEDFLSIYYSTMDRTNAEEEYYFSKEFYQRINRMKKNHCYFHVKEPESGKIISTELVIYGSENAYSYLGGTISDYFSLRPNDLLKYEIIKWCKEQRLKTFVFGGGYGADDGIFQYKSHFAPHGIVDFYIGKQVWDKERYDELCNMAGVQSHSRDLSQAGFFPEYRQ